MKESHLKINKTQRRKQERKKGGGQKCYKPNTKQLTKVQIYEQLYALSWII